MTNKSGKLSEYIDILPKTCTDFPIFYTEDELKYLEGTKILDKIGQIKSKF